jgi:hypothetical protein
MNGMYRNGKLNRGGWGVVFYLLMLRLYGIAVEPGAWWNDTGRGIKIKYKRIIVNIVNEIKWP